MKKFKTLSVEVDERGVACLVLDRADKRNALSAEMIAELTEAAGVLGAADDVRVVVLSGAGGVFCAGGDLAWMKAQVEAGREQRMAEARKLAGMLRALNEMPKPLIGRLHGGAFGGGVGLACVCDVVLADQDTKFGLTEVRLGLVPATIGPYVLARLGEGAARRVFFSGRVFGAREAADLGIVTSVPEVGKMEAAVQAEITPYLQAAPGAVAAAKALARRLAPPIGEAEIEASVACLADIWERDEAREGIEAFFGRRPAAWME